MRKRERESEREREGEVPSGWRTVTVKLIGKSLAQYDTAAPGNFRHIARTPAISFCQESFRTAGCMRHMIVTGYLDPNIQKGFLPTTPGVTEHQAKQAAIINAARRSTERPLAVVWLDNANAYGSVHHSLIQFPLEHYHAPPEFCQHATIMIHGACQQESPLKIGRHH